MLQLASALFIWGTIGLFVRYLPYDSAFIAFSRGLMGAAFLACFLLATRKDVLGGMPRGTLVRLAVSGVALGLNWVFLFEAFRLTTIAVATLCSYMAPAFVMLASPIVLRERLTPVNVLCLIGSFAGLALIILREGSIGSVSFAGIACGLGSAILYASVVLNNKFTGKVPALSSSVVQLLAAAVAVLPYAVFRTSWASLDFSATAAGMLLIVGLVHTGIAYALFFGAIPCLAANRIAVAAFIDPLVAVGISVLVLGEPLNLIGWIGAALILGSVLASELLPSRKSSD